jgi:hypothetical protein
MIEKEENDIEEEFDMSKLKIKNHIIYGTRKTNNMDQQLLMIMMVLFHLRRNEMS